MTSPRPAEDPIRKALEETRRARDRMVEDRARFQEQADQWGLIVLSPEHRLHAFGQVMAPRLALYVQQFDEGIARADRDIADLEQRLTQ